MRNKGAYIGALVLNFGPQCVFLITTIILSRYLSPNDFGMIGVLSVLITLASALTDSGLGGSLISHDKISDIDCSTIFVFNLVVSHILYLILIVFSYDIEVYYTTPGLASVTKLLSLIFVINSWGLVSKTLLIKRLNFKTLSIIAVISAIVASISSIVLSLCNFGVYSIVAYQLINALINTILVLCKSSFSISFKFSFNSFKKLFPFGIFTTLTTIVDTIYENIITIIFGKFLNIQQAGYLYQAKKIEEVPAYSLSRAINNAAFPILTRYKNTPREFVLEANKIFLTISCLLIPLLITISLFSCPIITILLGDKWAPAAPYLSILMFASIFILLENINRNFIKSLDCVNALFRYTLLKRFLGIVIIVTTAIFSVKYILYAYILSSFIGYIINSCVYSRILHISITEQFKFLLKLLFPNIIYYYLMVIIIYIIDNLVMQLCVSILLLGLYYFFVLPLYGFNLLKRIQSIVKTI